MFFVVLRSCIRVDDIYSTISKKTTKAAIGFAKKPDQN